MLWSADQTFLGLSRLSPRKTPVSEGDKNTEIKFEMADRILSYSSRPETTGHASWHTSPDRTDQTKAAFRMWTRHPKVVLWTFVFINNEGSRQAENRCVFECELALLFEVSNSFIIEFFVPRSISLLAEGLPTCCRWKTSARFAATYDTAIKLPALSALDMALTDL